MHTLHTTSPIRAFPPTGDLPRLPAPYKHGLRHATLPAERVCTENLTPFLKLLPCPARAGIAALLEPHKIFDADWHGLGVHVRWRAGAGVELVLTVQAVLDPVRISTERRRGEKGSGLISVSVELTPGVQTGRCARSLIARFRALVILLRLVWPESCCLLHPTVGYTSCPLDRGCPRTTAPRFSILQMVTISCLRLIGRDLLIFDLRYL
jgi:hypothetical protein